MSVCVHVHTGTHMHKENNLYEDACFYLYFLSSFSISVFGMSFSDSAKPTAYFLNVVFQAGKRGDAELNFEKIGLLVLSSSVAVRGQGKLKSLWAQHSLSLNQLWP